MGLTRIRADQIADIDYKQAVRAISLANVTLSLGAPSQVDGVNLSQGDRILVAGQSTATQNGIYRVDAVGTGANGTWVRANDANATGEIEAGMIVMVTEGTIWADTSWKLTTNNPIAIGGTALTFVQNTGDSYSTIIANGVSIFANAVSSAIEFSAGNNLGITGNATSDTVTFSVADAPVFTSISATGNVTGNYILGNGSQLTGLPAGYSDANAASFLAAFGSNTISTSGLITAGQFSGAGNTLSNIQGANVSGAVATATSATTAGTVTTAAQGNITSVGTLSALSVSGAVTVAGGIVNGGANGVGNIGSTGTRFNTIFATATSAQYADLAEMYCADADYAPGTVVEFGGAQEITQTTTTHSTCVAGIVSTNPSYLMNATLDCVHAVEVALVGRVPCQVIGTIHKGDRMVSSNLPGVATAMKSADYQPGCIIGKALEAYDSDQVGTIEVVVGRV